MRSLFFRMVTAFIIAMSVLLIVLFSIFFLGVQESIKTWNAQKVQDIQDLMKPQLFKSYRLQGKFQEKALLDALSYFLTDSLYVYVLDDSKKLAFLYVRGEYIAAGSPRARSVLQDLVQQTKPPLELRQADKVIGYLGADALDFSKNSANHKFIQSISFTSLIASLTSLCFSLGLVAVFSFNLSAKARLISFSISELARGKRNLSFPTDGPRELNLISSSALELQRQLEQEERARHQWAEDVSHDLRTPITAIKYQLDAMIDGVLAMDKERLKRVYEEVTRVESLIQDLHELNKLESPEPSLRWSLVDPHELAADVAESFSLPVAQKNLRFSSSASGGSFRADEHLLVRCLNNLIQNAIQYSEPGGFIEFSIDQTAGGVRFQVRNSGFISRDDLPRVFDRLFRGEKARSSPGSGLGLSIARAIVKAHNGRVSIGCQDQIVTVEASIPWNA